MLSGLMFLRALFAQMESECRSVETFDLGSKPLTTTLTFATVWIIGGRAASQSIH